MQNPSRVFWLLLAIAAAGVMLRAGAAVWWQARLPAGERFAFPDSESYWELGQTIAKGEAYQFRTPERQVFRTPGYPIVLAGVFRLLGDNPSVLWVRLLGALFGGAVVLEVGWLTWQLFDAKSALLAAIVCAMYPGAVGMSVFVLSEAVFCPLMLLQLNLWVLALREGSFSQVTGLGIAGGLVNGAAILVRPSWLLFVPFVLAVAVGIWLLRQIVRRFAKVSQAPANGSVWIILGGAILGTCLVMSPWWLRNWRVTGTFVPTSLQTGASLYDGLNKRADGGSNMEFVPQFETAQRLADARAKEPLPGTFETRLNSRFTKAALDWSLANPLAVLGLAIRKFVRMWNFFPNYSEFQSFAMRAAVFLGYTPIMLAALVGVSQYAKRGWPIAACYLPAVYFTALHMIFVSSIRYRQPPMLPLIALAAAAGMHVIWPKLIGARSKP